MSMEEAERRQLSRELCHLLQSDLLACDLLLSLLWAGAGSLRHDSLLRPFPSPHPLPLTAEGHRDITQLRALLQSLPSLDRVLESLDNTSSTSPPFPLPSPLPLPSLRLLHWAFSPKPFTVHYMPTAKLEEQLPAGSLEPRPDYVFHLSYGAEQEARFQQLATPHGTFLAFHGSAVECFHSIVHNGLLNMFNKTSAFGEGTYLSTHLGVSINWSPAGLLWPRSSLPHTASCMAVCEVIKHPSIMSRQQSGGEPSLQQAVPERYFVVTNDELVRVSHVLVFTRTQRRARRGPGWLRRHWFLVAVLVYLLLLALLSMRQSRWFKQLWTHYHR